MDAKGTSQLDPKLKEAYDRVMGTVIPQHQAPPSAPPPPSTPQPQIVEQQAYQQPVQAYQAAVATPLPTSAPISTEAPVKTHKSSKMTVPILVLGGVVFFIVYTVVWAKIFGLF